MPAIHVVAETHLAFQDLRKKLICNPCGFCRAMLLTCGISVRLSVYLSVALRYCIDAAKYNTEEFFAIV